jgi:hypothetical protein
MGNVETAIKRGYWAKAGDLVRDFRTGAESRGRQLTARRRRAFGWRRQGDASPSCKRAAMLAFGVAAAVAPTQSPAAPWDDAVLVFCRPVSGDADPSDAPGHCDCSIQNVETLISQDDVTGLLLALRRAGAVSMAELATFERQRDAACRPTVPKLATAVPGTERARAASSSLKRPAPVRHPGGRSVSTTILPDTDDGDRR